MLSSLTTIGQNWKVYITKFTRAERSEESCPIKFCIARRVGVTYALKYTAVKVE